MNLSDIADAAGSEVFDANIVDGSLVITPADAGIQIFAALATMEERFTSYETRLEQQEEILLDLRDNNGRLRDLLERTYGVLLESGQTELADEVIEAAYPVVGVADDGKEIRFEKGEQR
jgi:hypothetical protein